MNTAVVSPSVSATVPFSSAVPAMAVPQVPRAASSLARHVQHCARARGRWFTVRRAAESVHAAVSPRFFTSILVASAFICLLVEWM